MLYPSPAVFDAMLFDAVLHGPCRRGTIVVVHYNCRVLDDTLSRFSGIIVVRVVIAPLLFYVAAGLVDIAMLGEASS